MPKHLIRAPKSGSPAAPAAGTLSFHCLAIVLAALAPLRTLRAQDGAPVPPDGRSLYVEHCATCHGENGDGNGILAPMLEQKPRSFREGGFSFGNSADAIYRTVTAGIPNRSRMPGFRGVLTDDERRAVVSFVKTMTPAEEAAAVEARILDVGTRAVFARGILPPVVPGLPVRPRGLLVGVPDGLTFEYRTDDVRLLAVRQGRFVERTDWNGRGGSPLRPLGALVLAVGGGDPGPTFLEPGVDEPRPLVAVFRGTAVRGAAGVVASELRRADGAPVAGVEESGHAEGTLGGAGFTRRFEVNPAGAVARVALDIEPTSGPPTVFERVDCGGETVLVRDAGENGFSCVFVRHAELLPLPGGRMAAVVTAPAERPTSFTVTTILSKRRDTAALLAIAKEIRP